MNRTLTMLLIIVALGVNEIAARMLARNLVREILDETNKAPV